MNIYPSHKWCMVRDRFPRLFWWMGFLITVFLFVAFTPFRAFAEWWHFGPSQKVLNALRFLAPYSLKEFKQFLKDFW